MRSGGSPGSTGSRIYFLILVGAGNSRASWGGQHPQPSKGSDQQLAPGPGTVEPQQLSSPDPDQPSCGREQAQPQAFGLPPAAGIVSGQSAQLRPGVRAVGAHDQPRPVTGPGPFPFLPTTLPRPATEPLIQTSEHPGGVREPEVAHPPQHEQCRFLDPA